MPETLYFPLMILGAVEDHEHRIDVHSPYDHACIATVATANASTVEQALDNAHALFSNRKKWLTVVQRINILATAIMQMKEQAESLAMQAAHEGGKPLVDSRIEMTRCIDSFQICIDTLRTEACKAPVMGLNTASQQRAVFMKSEPIGVVVALSAFNHPLNLIAHQVGPAIATGCPIIIKPASDTPLSCIRLINILHEAGLEKGWCQWLIPDSHALSESLVTDARVAFFSFIGSAKVGWHLRAKLSEGTRCALEHGGIAPVIITKSADLDQALPSVLKGSFYHAGQVCVSTQRLFVHQSLAYRLAEMLANAAKKLVVGDPLSAQTDIGPLIRKSEVERVAMWVQAAVEDGAELLCGGHSLAHQCYAPTVLYQPSFNSKVSTHEVFGPVVCLYAFDDVDDAIVHANALDVAFQAAVYSQDMNDALYVSDRLDASAVMINDHTAFRVDWMPFAGLKHAGLGVGGIPHSMHDLQIQKMTVIHSGGIS